MKIEPVPQPPNFNALWALIEFSRDREQIAKSMKALEDLRVKVNAEIKTLSDIKDVVRARDKLGAEKREFRAKREKEEADFAERVSSFEARMDAAQEELATKARAFEKKVKEYEEERQVAMKSAIESTERARALQEEAQAAKDHAESLMAEYDAKLAQLNETKALLEARL